MNVFWHELRQRWKGTLGWLVGMTIFILVSFAKYSTLSQDANASRELVERFPATIQAVFGISGLDLMTLTGYFASVYLYIAILAIVHAGLVGSGVLADEEQYKTSEFLYVKPRSRLSIITQKLLAGAVLVTAMWNVAAAASWIILKHYDNSGSFAPEYWLFTAALAVMQLTFFSIGAVSAALSRNPKGASRIVSLVILVSYIIFALTKLVPAIDWMKHVSVFDYFDAVNIVRDGVLELHYIVICCAVSIVALAISYIVYRSRDLRV